MNQFDLSQTYKCSAAPGCSNKAVYYNRIENHCVLFCKYHRMAQFYSNSDEATFESMFTTAKNTTCEEIADYVDMSYVIHSRAMRQIFKYDGFDLEELKYLKLVIDYVLKEIRLFPFYRKFAKFQTPNIEEIKKYPKNIALRKDICKIIVMLKQLIMGLLINLPKNSYLRKILRDYINMHQKIMPKLRENKVKYKHLEEQFYYSLFVFKRISFRDIEFLSILHKYAISIFLGAVENPDILNHIDKSRRAACKKAVELIVEKTGIRLRPLTVFKGYKYYLNVEFLCTR